MIVPKSATQKETHEKTEYSQPKTSRSIAAKERRRVPTATALVIAHHSEAMTPARRDLYNPNDLKMRYQTTSQPSKEEKIRKFDPDCQDIRSGCSPARTDRQSQTQPKCDDHHGQIRDPKEVEHNFLS